eukprot:m.86382 g.86382  ORF g.86382 m.86382 type:complete len:437 (+) comp13056_c0_seq7:1475-2785(+)
MADELPDALHSPKYVCWRCLFFSIKRGTLEEDEARVQYASDTLDWTFYHRPRKACEEYNEIDLIEKRRMKNRFAKFKRRWLFQQHSEQAIHKPLCWPCLYKSVESGSILEKEARSQFVTCTLAPAFYHKRCHVSDRENEAIQRMKARFVQARHRLNTRVKSDTNTIFENAQGIPDYEDAQGMEPTYNGIINHGTNQQIQTFYDPHDEPSALPSASNTPNDEDMLQLPEPDEPFSENLLLDDDQETPCWKCVFRYLENKKIDEYLAHKHYLDSTLPPNLYHEICTKKEIDKREQLGINLLKNRWINRTGFICWTCLYRKAESESEIVLRKQYASDRLPSKFYHKSCSAEKEDKNEIKRMRKRFNVYKSRMRKQNETLKTGGKAKRRAKPIIEAIDEMAEILKDIKRRKARDYDKFRRLSQKKVIEDLVLRLGGDKLE